MAQLGIIKKGNIKIAPATTSAAVVDINRTRTLDASLQELVEAQALGFPAFSEATAYAVGDKVFYDRRIYRFTTAHAAGAWNAAQVEAVSMQNLFEELPQNYVSVNQAQSFTEAQKTQARQNIDVEAVLVTTAREQVLVEAVAHLQTQIDGLRASMANMGNMKAETINTTEIPAVCDNPLITLAADAPAVAPRVAGALYIDTTNNNIYYAKSVTSNSTGWVKLV